MRDLKSCIAWVSGAAYQTSKSAMRSMSNTLNLEEGHNGIRSTSICPADNRWYENNREMGT